jgi:plastocyanin
MRKLISLTLVCFALGLAALGCGGGDEDGAGGDGGGGAAKTDQPAGSGGGRTEVSMKNIQFDPNALTVSAGDTITFTNDEAVAHDVHKTSGPGKNFASGPPGGMQQGDTFKLTLNKAGKYAYQCDVHAPGMAGTITVK